MARPADPSQNDQGRYTGTGGILTWTSHGPVVVETAVLVALAPCLMLSGYSVLVVPAGVALVWGLLYRWTGLAWPRTDLNWCIAALLVLAAASLIVSSDRRLALPKITTLVLGIAWYFAMVRWRDAGLTLQSLTWALVTACFGLTVAGAVGTNWPQDGFYRVKFPRLSGVASRLPSASSGLTGEGGLHPNAVAGTLLLLIPFCIVPLSKACGDQRTSPQCRGRVRFDNLRLRNPLRWGAAGSVLILALAVLLLTQSRGGWLGALTTALALLLYRVRQFKALPAIPIVFAFGLACVIVVFWTAVPGASWLGGFYRLDDLDGKWAFRREMWWLGCQFIRDFPLTGVGFDGFRRLALIMYASPSAASGMDIAHPHNMWLSVGVDLGVPGIAAYLAMWVLAIRRLLQSARSCGVTEVLISQCLAAAWVGFWVFGITDAIPLGTKLGTALWPSLALGQILTREGG